MLRIYGSWIQRQEYKSSDSSYLCKTPPKNPCLPWMQAPEGSRFGVVKYLALYLGKYGESFSSVHSLPSLRMLPTNAYQEMGTTNKICKLRNPISPLGIFQLFIHQEMFTAHVEDLHCQCYPVMYVSSWITKQ
jgi:hypothetical protein